MQSLPKEGIEWIRGRSRITIKQSEVGKFIYLYLYPCYPDESRYIRLDFTIYGYQFYFLNILGNGHGSGFQGKGFGRLIVNLAIQLMRKWADEDASQQYIVGGRCVAMDTPSRGTDEYEKNVANRIRFWQGFGMHVTGNSDDENMRARLEELHCVGSGYCASGAPFDLKLEDFWPIQDRPILLDEDRDTFKSFAESIPAETILAQSQEIPVIREYTSVIKKRLVRILLLMLTSGVCAGAVLGTINTLFGPIVGWFLMGLGIFASSIVACPAANYFTSLSPAGRRLKDIESEHFEIIREVEEKVIAQEQNCNGLLWRLLPAMAEKTTEFTSSDYVDLANRSRHGIFSTLSRSELLIYMRVVIASRVVLNDSCIPRQEPTDAFITLSVSQEGSL